MLCSRPAISDMLGCTGAKVVDLTVSAIVADLLQVEMPSIKSVRQSGLGIGMCSRLSGNHFVF